MKYFKSVFIVIILSLLLTGCGKIKNSKGIARYIENEYNIEVEVVSFTNYDDAEDKNDRYAEFVLKEKDRDVTFEAKSYFSPIGMDGSVFWHQEETTDNYYESLTESIKDEIDNIAKKYNLEFDYSPLEGLVSNVNCHTLVEDENDLQEVLKAINEIMKLYNLKTEPIILRYAIFNIHIFKW